MTDSDASAMELAVRQAGQAAAMLQGHVVNEGKQDPTSLPSDDDALRARRAAKTVVDEVAQEILLLAAAHLADLASLGLDAEEDTPSTRLFSASPTGRVLVVDPVDGTQAYLEGRDSYSVCLGVVDHGRLAHALVLFPARDQMYILDAEGSYLRSPVLRYPSAGDRRLTAAAPRTRRVYVNGRVPAKAQQLLVRAGFEVVDDTVDGRGAPDCILACLAGEAVAYVAHTRQLRDLLLGGVLAGATDGYAVDWAGEPLVWPPGGRVPRAVFGATAPPGELIACLRDPDPAAG